MPIKRIPTILFGLTALAMLPNVMTALAYGVGSSVWLIPLSWLGLGVAMLLSLFKKHAAVLIGLPSAGYIWWLFADTIGWLLLFEPTNIVLYGVIVLPSLLALACVGMSVVVIISNWSSEKLSITIALSLVALLLLLVPASFAHRTYSQQYYANFKIDPHSGNISMTVSQSPASTQKFSVLVTSEEIRDHILTELKTSGTPSHPYCSNTKFKVLYNFKKLKVVTLTGFDGWKASAPESWNIEELDGDVSFLLP